MSETAPDYITYPSSRPLDDEPITPEQAETIADIKAQAYQNGHNAGFDKGIETTIHLTRHSQPYEITSDVSVKYSAKGEMQPEAAVKIVRYLENGDCLSELIRADLARGVEEMMTAIVNIRNGGVK